MEIICDSKYLADIKIYFIIKNGFEQDNVSKDMKSAFQESSKYFETETFIRWIKEEDCLKLEKSVLTKEYIFIFEEFKGTGFNKLKTTQAILLGPQCLLSCLMENSFIPLGSPIYTTAMRNLRICASGISNTEKFNIKTLINWMGGYYSEVLDTSCTHLISNTIKSLKYDKAASVCIPIMHRDWITDVWECNKVQYMRANHNDFDKHKLPIFFSLNITTTGLEKKLKNNIKYLVEKNGGFYNSSFKSETTEILVLEENMFSSKKCKAAMKFKKDCLNPNWVFDSVHKGYAVKMDNYRIKNTEVSTLAKNNLKSTVTASFNANCTGLSEISYISPQNFTINETCTNETLNVSSRSYKPETPKYKEMLKELNDMKAEMSVPFLDGCNENYLYELRSLTGKDLEKGTELINKNDTFKEPAISKLNFNATSKIINQNLEISGNSLLEQYFESNTSIYSLNKNSDSIGLNESKSSDNISVLFKDRKICVYGFDIEEKDIIEKQCRECGVEIVDIYFMGEIHYLILPIISNTTINLNCTPYETVNDLWLEDVIQQNKIISKEYYHEPIIIDDKIKPLLNLTIVTSAYTGTERSYLVRVAIKLGANLEDGYAKKFKPLLICSYPEGAKYNAAIKWNLPVVTSLWLYQCAKQKINIAYDKYLLSSEKLSLGVASTVAKSLGTYNELKRKLNEFEKEKIEGQKNISSSLRNPSLTLLESQTPDMPNPSPTPFNISDTLKTMETPIRNIIKKVLPRMNITPTTFKKTPPGLLESPEELWGLGRNASARSRRRNKRCLETLDAYSRPFEVPRHNTPFSEIKRRFWQEAMGEDYVDETNINSQFINLRNIGNTQNDEEDKNAYLAEELSPKNNKKTDNNEAFKMLKTFIENRVIDEPKYEKFEEVDSIPLQIDSEMSVDTQRVGWCEPNDIHISRRFKIENKMRYNGTPIFIISCSMEEQKILLQQQIKELNGDFCDNSIRYDELCSHIICEEPNRGEKVLSSVAAGKWILGIKYITDSILAGHFLDEELYEWGNPKATSLPQLSLLSQNLANSAYRWRQKIATDVNLKTGLFTTFRVILHMTSKKEQFRNVIKAGGGTVLNVKPPYQNSHIALSATHCFVDLKSEFLKKDHRALAEAGVNVLNVMYLNDYLTCENFPDITKSQLIIN